MPSIYFKWRLIEYALNSYDISKTILLNLDSVDYIPQGTQDVNRYLASDE